MICKHCDKWFKLQWQFTKIKLYQKCPHCDGKTFVWVHNGWRLLPSGIAFNILMLESIIAAILALLLPPPMKWVIILVAFPILSLNLIGYYRNEENKPPEDVQPDGGEDGNQG
jgi:hypothetical protein